MILILRTVLVKIYPENAFICIYINEVTISFSVFLINYFSPDVHQKEFNCQGIRMKKINK